MLLFYLSLWIYFFFFSSSSSSFFAVTVRYPLSISSWISSLLYNPYRTDIEITEKNSKVQITVTDEIIKKEIEIYKTYDENKRIPEAGISFTIYNNKNEKVTTITTDKNGKAQITLPYGEYKIVQNNTTDGYHKIDDIILSVKNDKEIKGKGLWS